MGYDIGWIIPRMRSPGRLWSCASSITVAVVGLFSKIILGEMLATQMVTLIHGCEQQFEQEQDHCWRILRVAECFKQRCQQHGIAPTMELLMAEFIMEAE